MKIRLVGVIGAGVIGRGVAQALAQTGHEVFLIDVCQNILEKSLQEIRKDIHFQGFFGKKTGKEAPETIIEHIHCSTDYHSLKDVEFVIENVTEKWSIKKELYSQIDEICQPQCIFAANTSVISITRIASVTQRSPRVIGVHFMNPVPVKNTVELIRGYHTTNETIATTTTLLTQMNKEAILVQDAPGFVSNRVLMLTINEAIFLLQEQIASANDIDHLFKACFGHKMGPLETADLIGLDTILLSIEGLYESFNDSKYRPCPLLKKMVDAGLYGRKSGQGFYSYK
jgi:3-hydroxybutyryl-CoA dehydrogenase